MTSFVRWSAFVFSLLLLAAPALGPSAPAYTWFHWAGAAVGLVMVFVRQGRGAPWFVLGFGLLDLYQLVASAAGWFPQTFFQWTPTDDLTHVVFGVALTALGGLSLASRAR